MAFDNDKLNEILVKQAEMKQQIDRLVSDAESEKEFRRIRNMDYENRIRYLEKRDSELHGKIAVTVAIGALLAGGAVTLIIKFL